MNAIWTDLNWGAVMVATIAYAAFSGIWHRPFAFGKKWENAMGFNRPENWKETTIYFIVPSIACFTTSVAIAILINLLNVNSWNGAFTLGLLTGIGFAMAVTFTNAVIPTMKKPLVFGAITGSAHALGITIATLIIYAITT
ncbi:DUF1761 domain-containing protein [Pararhodonellum marinum]|uniref:DUF1761 domain-containing protein n=1 Tax=Pararhodonellum marinum TaxID=2755358 RepID=UPI00188DECDE|nr:DUF1761 domain-containing protein [Pararhodonellum marinum]